MFNAKSETAHERAAFKEPFAKRRCVVPITGFYEWCREHGRKVPYYLTPQAFPGLLIAGLWDRWRDRETGEQVLSFTILTTAAHENMRFVHNRQPVMLSFSDAHRWLDGSLATQSLTALFESVIPMEISAIPVSTFVNNARNKDLRCIEPIGEPVVISASEQV